MVFVIMLGTVVLFQLIGLHAIIAGFFSGLVLSESIKSEILKQKLHAISYGVFIPVFFIVVGSKMDLSVFTEAKETVLLTLIIILGAVISKYFSGWLGAKLAGIHSPESSLVGVSTIPQLSTTLATVFVGSEMGLLNSSLVTSLIILSIVTTFIGPFYMRFFAKLMNKHVRTALHKVDI